MAKSNISLELHITDKISSKLSKVKKRYGVKRKHHRGLSAKIRELYLAIGHFGISFNELHKRIMKDSDSYVVMKEIHFPTGIPTIGKSEIENQMRIQLLAESYKLSELKRSEAHLLKPKKIHPKHQQRHNKFHK